MLHVGAQAVDYDGLRSLPTPEATRTHVPIPHFRVIDMLRHTLGFYGHQISEENYGVTEDGNRFFGVMSLKSEYTGYTDTVGLRNSHDRSFPVGISFGSRVFVCDNLAFIADHVVKRKHTANAKRDLPGLVGGLIEPLALQREQQARTFDRYKATELTDGRADGAIMQMFRQGVIGVQKIADVLHQWEDPECDWGDRTAWRLFNAATFALTGKVSEQPRLTSDLHAIIDSACEPA